MRPVFTATSSSRTLTLLSRRVFLPSPVFPPDLPPAEHFQCEHRLSKEGHAEVCFTPTHLPPPHPVNLHLTDLSLRSLHEETNKTSAALRSVGRLRSRAMRALGQLQMKKGQFIRASQSPPFMWPAKTRASASPWLRRRHDKNGRLRNLRPL